MIVNTDEAYFVVTPHEAGKAYYAVVLSGDTKVDPSYTVGHINETTDSVQVIIQYQDEAVTIYSHWINGRRDYDADRPDYPVMGNEYSNGLGFNFALWEPVGGRPEGNLPLVVGIHGGGSDLSKMSPYGAMRFWTKFSEGLFVTLDDAMPIGAPGVFLDSMTYTFWFGYNTEYNRFSPSLPSGSAIVVNYTDRRVLWELDWLINNLPVDTARISVMGASMGGIGTLVHTQLKPDIFSAGLAFVPIFDQVQPQYLRPTYLFGAPFQELATNLPDSPKIYDVLNQNWHIQRPHEDWPFTIIVSGKNDILAPWWEKPEGYRQLDSTKTGFALYWDEREHMGGSWLEAHFGLSEHIHASYLARFRKDQSFPAFSETDLDLITPGRQPDPGDGAPESGNPWGTWGGYLEWDPESIVDTAEEWSITLWVVFESAYDNDIPDGDTILTHVTPRRLQVFQLQPGQTYFWDLVRLSDGDILQVGEVEADTSGIITVPDLLLIKEPVRLTVW